MMHLPGQIGAGLGLVTPPTPTLSIVAGDGTVTATITGDFDATNYLVFKTSSDTDWQPGGSRTGDGDIVVTDLLNDSPYIFIAYSREAKTELVSLPAIAKFATLQAASENEFDEILAEDINDFLDVYGEDIVYLPRGGGSRDIVAVIYRKGITQRRPGTGTTSITIIVANDSTIGISSSEFDSGGDRVSIAPRMGKDPINLGIKEIIKEDAGMMILEVR